MCLSVTLSITSGVRLCANASVSLLKPGTFSPLILSSSLPFFSLSPHPEPGPLMKLGVSGSVRLIGQVCPGLRLPVIEASSEGPLCSRRCTLLRSTPTAKTLPAPVSAFP
ncbi:hypothetical protein E3U43_004526%2C partial [Xyrichtys novacula]|uniref:Uncharacterized protein n=1 Tax=Xyrichtys novacula TaxID=13765 RepID=A0AAV1F4N0_XYRNO|nr:hypothetical protein E3U43_004526%2C partial [Xyrichtys novacula]